MSAVEDLKSRISASSFDADAKDNQQRILSDRQGDYWMDGQACLANLDRVYTRPWHGCIGITELSKENLPPFYVRLRDDQVKFLWDWARKRFNGFSKYKLNHFWPHDFGVIGKPLASRPQWIPSEASTAQMPEYRDLGLPQTFCSSGKYMAEFFKQVSVAPLDEHKDGAKAERMQPNGGVDMKPENQAMEEELMAVKTELENSRDRLCDANTRLQQQEAEIQSLRARDDLEENPASPRKKPKYSHDPDPHHTNETAPPTGLGCSDNSNVSELKSEQAEQEQQQQEQQRQEQQRQEQQRQEQQQQLRDLYAASTNLYAQWEEYHRDRTESLLAARAREDRHAMLRETIIRNQLREIMEFVREVAPDQSD